MQKFQSHEINGKYFVEISFRCCRICLAIIAIISNMYKVTFNGLNFFEFAVI